MAICALLAALPQKANEQLEVVGELLQVSVLCGGTQNDTNHFDMHLWQIFTVDACKTQRERAREREREREAKLIKRVQDEKMQADETNTNLSIHPTIHLPRCT